MSAFCGVKVAIVPVAESSVTDAAVTGVNVGAGPASVNVAAVTLRGSMRKPTGTVKVALMVAFGHTADWPAVGLVDLTETGVGVGGGGAPRSVGIDSVSDHRLRGGRPHASFRIRGVCRPGAISR